MAKPKPLRKPNKEEKLFLDAYVEHLGDMGLVASALQIEPEACRAIYVRPLVRQWMLNRLISREQKWRGIADLCKGALTHALTAPGIPSRERVAAAKVGLDAIVRGNLCDLRDGNLAATEEARFDTAIDATLGEGAVARAVEETEH